MNQIDWEDAVGKTLTAFYDSGDTFLAAFGDEYTVISLDQGYSAGDAVMQIDERRTLDPLDLLNLGAISKENYDKWLANRQAAAQSDQRARLEAEYERLGKLLGKDVGK